MRTQEEIVARFAAAREEFVNFTPEVLVGFLDFDHARPYLKPEATAADWEQVPADPEHIIGEMRAYMADYGWPKVEEHRGLSADRTVQKMGVWLWLLGDDEMAAFADSEANYPQYGAPILKRICEKYGFPIPTGERVQRMARGERCGAEHDCGCGV